MKINGICDQGQKYRLRYNLTGFIYSKGPLQHNIKVSESFTAILNYDSRLNSIFRQNSQNEQWKMIFFLGPGQFQR